jgi:hypothetical protein
METRPDAEWCWHCGYDYDLGTLAAQASPGSPAPAASGEGDDGVDRKLADR